MAQVQVPQASATAARPAGLSVITSRAASATVPHRWLALVFIAMAQLMVALDATIVSIALPTAQGSLHASDAQRQWVITAYTLTLGGLLLLGGRVADRIGRKRAFLIGLIGFAVASAAGGAAVNFVMLTAARALQGAAAALLMPTALSLLAVTFTEPRERATAFTVFGSIAGSGAALGLLLGGVLTQYLTWRWCLYVNVLIAMIAAAGGWRLLPSMRWSSERTNVDVTGAVLVTGALIALVYACTQAVSQGWGSPMVSGLLAATVAQLAAFVVCERTARTPLLPLRIILERNRAGASCAVLFAVAGMFASFLLLTYFLQVVLRYSPLQAGVGFLPITIASQLGSWLVARRLMPRVAPRALLAPGLTVAAGGMLLLTQLQPHSSYLSGVLPAELLLGFGLACAMVPAFSIATFGVTQHEAGVASAVVMTAQQVGGSFGTALLNTFAASTTAALLAAHGARGGAGAIALVRGYTTATAWGAGLLLAGAAAALVLVNAHKPSPAAS